MTHHEAMNAPLHRQTCCDFHGIDCRQGRDCPERGYLPARTAWDREQADTPPYTVEDMTALEWWAVVAVCVLALLAAASPIFWSAI